MSEARPHFLAFPALLVGNAALAFGPWLVRLSDVGPVATGFWRVALAAPMLFAVASISGQAIRRPSRAVIALIVAAAIFYSLDLAAWNAGIRMTKLGNATLFGNSGSFVFAAYALWLARRLPTGSQTAAIALALLGSALLMGSSYTLSPRNFEGDLLALAAGLLYGGYLILIGRCRVTLTPLPLLFLVTCFSVPILLAISLGSDERIWPHNWFPPIIFALSSQLVGQGLLVYSIGTLPPLVVGLALLTQPAISAAVGWIAYKEALTLADVSGAAAIAVALVLVRLPDRTVRTRCEGA